MLEPQEEYMLAKRWREHGDREAAHKLVTSHLRLVAKIAMGYRGYGLPIGEVISEGNVGLMQAVKRFEPEKGFKLATYAMWWIRASIQEYILRSWSLVKMGTTASQKKLFFNLRKAKSRISALDEGDLRDDQVETISKRLGVAKQDVIDMNRRLGGDASLNAPLREEGEGEWQDWLVDDTADQESLLAEREESDTRLTALRGALSVLNPRERRIFEARRLAEDPITLEELSAEFGVSRERVRQIEVRAFEKVQAAVKAGVAKALMPKRAARRAAGALTSAVEASDSAGILCKNRHRLFRILHEASDRRARPPIEIDCRALPIHSPSRFPYVCDCPSPLRGALRAARRRLSLAGNGLGRRQAGHATGRGKPSGVLRPFSAGPACGEPAARQRRSRTARTTGCRPTSPP